MHRARRLSAVENFRTRSLDLSPGRNACSICCARVSTHTHTTARSNLPVFITEMSESHDFQETKVSRFLPPPFLGKAAPTRLLRELIRPRRLLLLRGKSRPHSDAGSAPFLSSDAVRPTALGCTILTCSGGEDPNNRISNARAGGDIGRVGLFDGGLWRRARARPIGSTDIPRR